LVRLLAIEAMEKFPRGIAKPEEWLAVFGDEEMVVVTDL
jgi:hypothetical protein